MNRDRWLLTAVVCAALLASFAGRGAKADGAETQYGDLDDASLTPLHDHAACSFFGANRERYLQAGLGSELRTAQMRSELTQQVVQNLGAVTPARSRGAAWKSQFGGSGPIAGDSIDDFIFGALEQKGIPAAPTTTDAEFTRRVTLDLIGRTPTLQESLDFLEDAAPDKRERLVARLLDDPRWADRWAMFFGDLFRNTQFTAQVNRYPGGRDALHLFLLQSLRDNKPYDELAREMILGAGYSDGRNWPAATDRDSSPFASFEAYRAFLADEPVRPNAASYIVGGRTTGGPVNDTYDAMAVNMARDFLGVTHMDCLLCHDGLGHLDLLSAWGTQTKRAEAWGVAAFFQQVVLGRPVYRLPARDGEGQGAIAPYWIVTDLAAGQVLRNRRGQTLAGEYRLNTEDGNRPARHAALNGGIEVVAPRYLNGEGPRAGEPYRAALGRLLTGDRQFARAAVNYVWAEFFGRGIVDPVDQFDLARLDPASPPPEPWTIQPSNPELLEHLADGFITSGFDLKALMRDIATSQAYQLSSRYDGAWNASYDQYFARHQVRRLDAEELHDSIVVTSGVPVIYTTTPAIGPTPFAMRFPDVQGFPVVNGRTREEAEAAASFLDAFFRGDREETLRSGDGSILQALQLMNNPLVVTRVSASASQGALANLMRQNDQTLVGLLYLDVLGRVASPEELSTGVAHLQGGERQERAEDLMWSLYNKVDFIYNY